MSASKDPSPTAEVRKFMFDRSFDIEVPAKKEEKPEEEAPEPAEPEVVVPTFSEEEMNAARAQAFAEGKEEGRAEMAAATEREVLVTLNGIADRLKALSAAQDATNASIMENAIEVAIAIARKVFPALSERHAFGEIERMVTKAIGRILEEPKVVIYVSGKIKAAVQDRLGPLAAKAGFKGEITVEGLDDLIVGDVRVEWMGGGAKREMAALWHDIDDIVARNLSGAAEAPAEADQGLDSASESEPAADPAPTAAEARPADVEPAPGGAILDGETDDAAPEPTAPATPSTGAGEAGPDTPDPSPAAPGADETPTDRGDQ